MAVGTTVPRTSSWKPSSGKLVETQFHKEPCAEKPRLRADAVMALSVKAHGSTAGDRGNAAATTLSECRPTSTSGGPVVRTSGQRACLLLESHGCGGSLTYLLFLIRVFLDGGQRDSQWELIRDSERI